MLTAVLPVVADSRELGWGPRAQAFLDAWSFSTLVGDATSESQSRVIEITNVGQFVVDWNRRKLIARHLDEAVTPLDLQHVLQDHLVPRLLAEAGMLVLHAGAVNMDGVLALFLGESGAGKSTLTASLHARGFALLGDDAMVVDRCGSGFEASAVYRSLRLFHDSLHTTLKGTVRTSPMADYSDKQQVLFEGDSRAPEGPLPIGAMFFLTGPGWHSAPQARLLAPTKAFIELVGQSFSLDPRDPKCGARRLARASELALGVPSYELSYRHDYDDLNKVHTMIERCIAANRSHATAGVSQ